MTSKSKALRVMVALPCADFTAWPVKCGNVENVADGSSGERF